MRLRKVILLWYRSVDYLEFEVGPLTVLFGKNNTGKTNVLEAIYGVFALQDTPGHSMREVETRGVRGPEDMLPPWGAVYAEMEQGLQFDDEVLTTGPGKAGSLRRDFATVHASRLPPQHVSFIGSLVSPGLVFADPHDFFVRTRELAIDGYDDPEMDEWFASMCIDGPRPRSLFLDWEFDDIDERVGAAIIKPMVNTSVFGEGVSGWLEAVDSAEGEGVWRVRPEIHERIDQFASLATTLLPDFIDGSIRAQFHVPTTWGASPWVSVEYEERDTGQRADSISDIGRGAARWIAVSTQIAQHLTVHGRDIVRGAGQKPFSGHVLFVDEPEAHLHPSAVASIVRWCQRMVEYGFNVVVASHHEEFLRAAGDDLTLVHVTRNANSGHTHARTLPSSRTTRLLELAADVGMHPASALSIRRAILFVEGPLDEAVLDEYAHLELDGAGVKIIPIHGTRNLEGLVAIELVTDLGIKMGILTDATDPTTMAAKSGNKRSSEERKLMRVIQMAKDKGVPPPTPFGVPEDDLLFALPADAIRDHLKGPFPGWAELVSECRQTLGKGPSDSVDWKSYANERYGLQITTPGGVRDLVRALDLKNVPLPSIRAVIDKIVDWAQSTADTE